MNIVFNKSRSKSGMLNMVGGCRSGSMCLDVINQTWSPMFGESPSFSSRFYNFYKVEFEWLGSSYISILGSRY
jgi:hypothetical protein